MFVEDLGAQAEEFTSANLKTCLLETLDDLADLAASHTIGFEKNERCLHRRGSLPARPSSGRRIFCIPPYGRSRPLVMRAG